MFCVIKHKKNIYESIFYRCKIVIFADEKYYNLKYIDIQSIILNLRFRLREDYFYL